MREGQAAAELEVLLRVVAGLAPDEVERRIAHAATEVVRQLDRGLRVGLRTATTRFPPDAGASHRATLLSHLAGLEIESRVQSSDALEREIR